MKSHLIIKLKASRAIPQLAYWEDIIHDKRNLSKQLIPSIDRILKEKYKIDFISTQNYKSKLKDWTADEVNLGLNRVYRLILLQNNPEIPPSLIDEISYLPQVSFVRKGEITTSEIPQHQFSETKSLSSKYINNGIYLGQAHLFTKGIPDIKVAVLDTGIETNHNEFKSDKNSGYHKFSHAKDFVDIINGANTFIGDFLGMDDIPDDLVGHGTHVSGIIGAYGKKMPLGVAPNVTIMPIKVLGAMKSGNRIVGAGLVDNINSGIKYAVDQGADVINMSLGIKHEGGGLPHKDVIAYAIKNNVTVIAASGNDGKNDKYYPGALKGVIAVGASDNQGHIASFSTFGTHVSLTAPGVNVYSTHLNNGYAMSSGTSQASPFVSGTVALLKSYAKGKGKKISNELVRYILQNTTDKFTNQYKDQKLGYGRVNVLDALKMLKYNL